MTKNTQVVVQAKKRKWWKLGLVGVFGFFLVQWGTVQYELRQNATALAGLEQQIADQELTNAEYEQLLAQKDNADFMERMARDSKSLQMVYPGEQVYYDITGE